MYSQKLTSKAIKKSLSRDITREIFCFNQIDSTNAFAEKLCRSGDVPCGSIVAAMKQTCGSGRMGRSFFSPEEKGLYFSYIIDIENQPRLSLITSYAALAVIESINTAVDLPEPLTQSGADISDKLNLQIKWPNDIMLSGKKLCGILTKLITDTKSNKLKYAVLGIGINLSQDEGDFPEEIKNTAISLKMGGAEKICGFDLTLKLIKQLDKIFIRENWLLKQSAVYIERLKALSCTVGSFVNVIKNGKSYFAFAADISNDGGLLLEKDGQRFIINSGEISIRNIT